MTEVKIGYLPPTRDQAARGEDDPARLIALARHADGRLIVGLAGGGDPALRRVARLGDGWSPCPPAVTDYARDRATILRPAVRSVTSGLYATLRLDGEASHARRPLRSSIERSHDAPPEKVERIQAMFAGAAVDTAAWLDSYIAAGSRHLVIRLVADDHHAALERFAVRAEPLLSLRSHR